MFHRALMTILYLYPQPYSTIHWKCILQSSSSCFIIKTCRNITTFMVTSFSCIFIQGRCSQLRNVYKQIRWPHKGSVTHTLGIVLPQLYYVTLQTCKVTLHHRRCPDRKRDLRRNPIKRESVLLCRKWKFLLYLIIIYVRKMRHFNSK